MDKQYRITLSPALIAEIEQRSELDEDDMLAFVQQLRKSGMDLIFDALGGTVSGVDVEFIEPAEVPELIWARFFLQLQESNIMLTITQGEHRLFLEKG